MPRSNKKRKSMQIIKSRAQKNTNINISVIAKKTTITVYVVTYMKQVFTAKCLSARPVNKDTQHDAQNEDS